MSIERIFSQLCKQSGLPEPVTEYRWHPSRRFRADYAWPEHLVLLEVEGGLWIKGKHGRGSGIVKDIEKSNEAAARGWLVLRCQPKELLLASTLGYIKAAMSGRPNNPDRP